jgi:hypothetical protein
MKKYHYTPLVIGLLLLITVLSGCDSSLLQSSSESDTSPVKVQMRTVQSDQLSDVAGKQQNLLADNELVIEGDNGTLTITDLRFVLSKFELEGEGGGRAGPPEDLPEEALNNRPGRDGDDDDDDNGEGDDEDDGENEEDEGDDDEEEHERNLKVEDDEFKLTNTFVDVPLDVDEEAVLAALGDLELQPGTYHKLEFKIEEGDFDDESALLSKIRTEFPDWPEEASLVAVGSFTPTGGESREFTVFFDAEIKIELELDPPLQVSGSETPTITIDFDPTRLFKPFGSNVPDLSAHDYSATGELVDLELEIEDSFRKVELEYGF